MAWAAIPPANVAVVPAGPFGMRVTFDAVAGVDGYRVVYTVGNVPERRWPADESIPATDLVFQTLAPGTTYTVWVVSVTSGVESALSAPVTVTTPTSTLRVCRFGFMEAIEVGTGV